MPKKYHGTSLDSFLKEEGVLQRVQDSVLVAVHDTAKGLHKAGAMNQRTLSEFDRLCEPATETPASTSPTTKTQA